MENNVFTYQYSASRNREVERIRSKYLPREVSKMEQLRRLDFKAQTAGQLQGLVIGVIGCLIFGIGMCFGLDVFAGAAWLAVLFCAPGAAIMILAYPVYRFFAKKAKAELTPEILRLSDEIIQAKKED